MFTVLLQEMQNAKHKINAESAPNACHCEEHGGN